MYFRGPEWMKWGGPGESENGIFCAERGLCALVIRILCTRIYIRTLQWLEAEMERKL